MDRLGGRQGSRGGVPGDLGAGAATPGKQTLVGQIYLKAASGPQASAPAPGDAFGAATAGASSALPHQAQMEASFGQSFGGVTAHVGTPEAQGGLADLGARAASHGETVAFAEASPDPHLVAHELAHVVQQRRGGGGVQAKAAGVSRPTDAAEIAADRAADAVIAGEPVPDVGTADGATLHRTTVNSNGGVFDNAPMYAPVNGTGAVGDRVGANIMLDFTPNDLVEAPLNGIALIQSVKGVTDRVGATNTVNPHRDQGNTAVSTNADDTGLVAGNGVAIDVPIHMGGGRTDANHNPIYGVGFGAHDPSTNLSGGTPTLGRTQRGAHVKHPDGSFDAPIKAQMEDGPGRVIGVANQTFEMNFEVTALVTDGPMANTFLGSVEWGWQSDTAGNVTLKPFVPLASGAPTANFMTAAQTWNAATFHNDDGTTVDSIDIPLTTLPSSVQAAVDLPTAPLISRLRAVSLELAALTSPGVERTNKAFEKRALEAELKKRKINIDLVCLKISDTGGAATPAEDEVWLSVDNTKGASVTGQRTFRAGAAHTYEFSCANFFPMDEAVHIAVNEHDRAGATSAAHDDALLELDWAPPFVPQVRVASGGTYLMTVHFDR